MNLVSRIRDLPRRAIGNSFWSVADQGLFAVSNFVLNLILARWLSAADYGAFSLAFTLFLLLGTVHTALVVEPLLVFGAGRYNANVGAYLRSVLNLHWVLAALLSLVLGALVFLWPSLRVQLGGTTLALMFAAPLILFQWLARRACYIDLQPALAARAGGVYLALTLALATLLFCTGALTPVTALLVMAAASVASAAQIFRTLLRSRRALELFPLHETWTQHWQYGKWALGAALLSFVPGNVAPFFLSLSYSLDAVGAYRALWNLLQPAMQLFTALGVMLLPTFRKQGAALSLRRWTGRLLLVALGYALLLAVFREPLLELLYGKKYLAYSPALILAGLVPLSSAVIAVLAAFLRAAELPRAVFWGYAGSAAFAVTGGLVLIQQAGVEGAVVAAVLGYALTAAVLLWATLHLRKRGARPD